MLFGTDGWEELSKMGLNLDLGDEGGPGSGVQGSHEGQSGQESVHGLIPRLEKWRDTWLLPPAKGGLTHFICWEGHS